VRCGIVVLSWRLPRKSRRNRVPIDPQLDVRRALSSRRDLAIDVADKLVLTQATGVLYDRLRRD
jgi:hypothetical protein